MALLQSWSLREWLHCGYGRGSFVCGTSVLLNYLMLTGQGDLNA